MSVVTPHIITVNELITYAQVGFTKSRVQVDSAGVKTRTTATSIDQGTQDRMALIIRGVEADFERRTLMSFGEYKHDLVSAQLDLSRTYGSLPFHLKYANVQDIDTTQGDYLQFRGLRDTDWTDFDSGDYHFDTHMGIVYFESFRLISPRRHRVRARYRYGTMENFDDVKFAVMKKSYVDLMQMDNAKTVFKQSNLAIPLTDMISKFREDYEDAIMNRRNLVFIR